MKKALEETIGVDAVYCINLDRRPERWERARNAIVKAGFPSVQRVSAVDGADVGFDDARLSVRLASIVKTTYTAPLGVKRGVIGCYLSHLAVWQKVVLDGVKRCVIFEDDVRFVPGFAAALEADVDRIELDSLDAYFFGYLKRAALAPDGRLRGRIWGTQSYLVTQLGAQKLLERALPLTEAIDEHFEHLTLLDDSVRVFCTAKSLVRQDSIVSDVQPISYVFGNKISRLIQYFLLTGAVAAVVWMLI